ncbi:hypothetical protein ACFQ48_10990 [Hymenobacter caeli]|uniref:DUF3575 domain-containing protein n=1 Tax=Hymenobacter caeli TaxID=2735894 RepID=A0ABX2FSI1_9BACT|nr:hypothetical protein [Hymenobacter caeli]NRT19912.1 hypothetical protein [Hymenobacter caeli]
MKTRLFTKLVWLLAGALGPTGCAVYMPMQCAAPAVQDKGQVEATASAYFNSRLNAGVNYSPVRHLVVRAAADGKQDKNDSTYYRSSQYEVAVGTYWPLGKRVLVGALGGAGRARSQARYSVSNYYGYQRQYQFDARYNKFFGEAYAAVQFSPGFSAGAAYRLTQVQFVGLTDLGQPLDLRRMLRGESMFFVRGAFGSGPRGERPLYAQFGFGASRLLNPSGAGQQAGSPEAEVLQGRGYFTVGLGFFPHALFRRP